MHWVTRVFTAVLLCPLVAFQALGQDPQPAQAAPALNIVILEGEGAINNIKQRTAREPIVRVEDENHKPVAGALVLFELPQNGAGATFANGAHTATFTTDQNGQVVARGLRPNRIQGKYQMKVTASSQGRTAVTTISQTNVVAAGAGAGAAAGISTKLLVILSTLGAAAVAGGVYAATHSGGKSPTTVTAGSPGVGAPK